MAIMTKIFPKVPIVMPLTTFSGYCSIMSSYWYGTSCGLFRTFSNNPLKFQHFGAELVGINVNGEPTPKQPSCIDVADNIP